MRKGEAPAAGASRRTGAGRLWRAALLAPALAALVMTAGAAAAQESAGSGNAREAIEITADTLEVRQSENIAIFEGSVEAIQGEMVLTAEKLTVHYQEAAEGEGNLGVSHIDAEGNVVISSPQETAKGARGSYDVEEGLIELAGGVVLNQADNIVRGDALTMDLEAGVSRVVGAGSTRVESLFVPEEEGE